MQNVNYEVSGDKLTITVDLSRRLGPSSTGKTTLIASTQGTAKINSNTGFGLTVFTKEKDDAS